MSSAAQILANQQNAKLSRGPTSDQGKSRSRLNATTHGLTGKYPSEEITISLAYSECLNRLTDEIRPAGEQEMIALRLAAGAAIQANMCMDKIALEEAKLRRLANKGWHAIQRNEALALSAKLSRHPAATVAKLEETAAGCRLLIDRWKCLKMIAAKSGKWEEAHTAAACDLLGLLDPFRDLGPKLIAAQGHPVADFEQSLADQEIARLNSELELWANDEEEAGREAHLSGAVMPYNAVTHRLMRYHGEATRRYHKFLRLAGGGIMPPASLPFIDVVTDPEEAYEAETQLINRIERRTSTLENGYAPADPGDLDDNDDDDRSSEAGGDAGTRETPQEWIEKHNPLIRLKKDVEKAKQIAREHNGSEKALARLVIEIFEEYEMPLAFMQKHSSVNLRELEPELFAFIDRLDKLV